MKELSMKPIYSRQEIEEVHDTLTFLVKVIASQPEQDGWRKAVANMRQIDVKFLEEYNCFFIPDMDYLVNIIGETHYTNLRLGFLNTKGQSALKARFVFPCYNSKNKVVGLVGYDNLTPNFKYLLSTTMGFEKSNVTYGYKDIQEFYKHDYVILVEGVMEYFRLRSLGYPVFCLQGTLLYTTHRRLLNRIKNKITFLDSDNAGFKGAEEIASQLDNCTQLQMKRYGLSKIDPDKFLSYPENVVYFRFIINHIQSSWKQLNYNTVLMSNQSPELQQIIEEELAKKLERENKLLTQKGATHDGTTNTDNTT